MYCKHCGKLWSDHRGEAHRFERMEAWIRPAQPRWGRLILPAVVAAVLVYALLVGLAP